jgi:transcriptional regulator with XRE-family HTH domain
MHFIIAQIVRDRADNASKTSIQGFEKSVSIRLHGSFHRFPSVEYAKRRMSMKTSHSERDDTCGTAILTLRTAIGLTQEGLARHLGISRQAVGKWEGGGMYPKAEHLKEVIALAVQHQAFPVGHEAEEIRTLWKVARQKIRFDERLALRVALKARLPATSRCLGGNHDQYADHSEPCICRARGAWRQRT